MLKGIRRKKKNGFWDFNALRSSCKGPASATRNEINSESVQKRVWVPEWVMASIQESRNPSSSGNCCFSSGEEFPRQKNKQNEVGEAMWSSSKQNKNKKLWYIPEVTSFVTSPILYYAVSFIALGQSGKFKIDFMAKSIEIHVVGLKTFLDIIDIPKPKKKLLDRMDT